MFHFLYLIFYISFSIYRYILNFIFYFLYLVFYIFFLYIFYILYSIFHLLYLIHYDILYFIFYSRRHIYNIYYICISRYISRYLISIGRNPDPVVNVGKWVKELSKTFKWVVCWKYLTSKFPITGILRRKEKQSNPGWWRGSTERGVLGLVVVVALQVEISIKILQILASKYEHPRLMYL